MRATFSLGVLTALISGAGSVFPAIADVGRSTPLSLNGALDGLSVDVAPVKGSSDLALASSSVQSPAVAIRQIEESATPARPSLMQQAPIVPLASAPVRLPEVAQVLSGQASWYGPGFFGNRTASGEVFRPGTLTAAHRTLPFGTKVRVTNLSNGRSAVVRINDRGPFHGNRVIDLAHGAARDLGVVASGVASVKLEVLR
ncbi:septal ring lytic transglycosylase RlpA family protein [Synechococcus sp. CS-1328]|uniref:septal ring lytic transglycosylase RlpA family protein n=1 Tax=Synechococcus sp. CS-1328 TaxID=2847976 RepID=UPI00223B2E43|nr:septal ring lytic transglycosylase RlpA family protein [Synechococcus sp. CS-1328]MCT0225366.1 septal ring lytic transglycosylase RlpA family protein [Synechococcus sp. CS-1328]